MRLSVLKSVIGIGIIAVGLFAVRAAITASPPVAQVEFTVTDFKPAITTAQNEVSRPFDDRRLTGFTLALPAPPAGMLLAGGTWQDRWVKKFPKQRLNHPASQTIVVPKTGAILRFIVKSQGPEVYDPIGITFERADDSPDKAVPLVGGTKPSPFSNLQVKPGELLVTDIPLGKLEGWHAGKKEPRPAYITYKFSLHIKRRSDGAEGIIDPYVENENPP